MRSQGRSLSEQRQQASSDGTLSVGTMQSCPCQFSPTRAPPVPVSLQSPLQTAPSLYSTTGGYFLDRFTHLRKVRIWLSRSVSSMIWSNFPSPAPATPVNFAHRTPVAVAAAIGPLAGGRGQGDQKYDRRESANEKSTCDLRTTALGFGS